MAELKTIPLLLLLAILAQNANTARILAVIPSASYSHQMFYQPFWRELALRGHDMVVVTTDPTNETLPNFKEISIRESYAPMKKMLDLLISESMLSLLLSNKMTSGWANFSMSQMNLPQIKALIDNTTEHFDLLITEHFLTPFVALKHHYKCPLIGVMSLDGMTESHSVMGNPVHRVLYPSAMMPFQDDMSFFQRLIVVVLSNIFEHNLLSSVGEINTLMRERLGADIPHLVELFEETDMLFLNANPLFSAVRPHTPSTINLAGGIHMRPQQPLPKEIKEFLDDAKQGAIYFSLGSNVKSKELPLELRTTIMDTLAHLPYKVLWKFEDDSLPGKPKNVKITKWAPQQDVLRHPNVKLFITQGGLQSLEEALYSHIPLVVMPFMADQEANAAKVNFKGLGLVVDRYNLNVDNFKATIQEVIDNPVYKNNVATMAKRIQDEPMTPLERAVWWTEYVLRHKGAQHLKGPKIPNYQYYYLDVMAFLVVVLFAIVALFYGIVKLVCRCVKCLCGCKKTDSGKTSKKSKRE